MKLPREQISNNVAEILETLIVKGTGMFPGVKPHAGEIVDRVNTLTYYQLRLREPIDFFDARVEVKVLDKVAKEQTRRSQVVAVTAGVSTGFFGLPGLAVDLPVLVANTVGLVRRHAVTYGFTTIEDSTNDPTPLLLALGASVGADMVIDRVGVKVGEKVGLDLGTKLVEKYLVSRISEQFAARIITELAAAHGTHHRHRHHCSARYGFPHAGRTRIDTLFPQTTSGCERLYLYGQDRSSTMAIVSSWSHADPARCRNSAVIVIRQ